MLPFDGLATVANQSGTVLATDVPIHLDEAGSNTTRVGVVVDYLADVHVSAAEHLVNQVNRRLLVDGRIFKVISAVSYPYVPHLEVGLKETRGG